VSIHEQKGEKQLAVNEQDLYLIVNTLQPMGFAVATDVLDIYQKIEEI
jgi:hypothetical protein